MSTHPSETARDRATLIRIASGDRIALGELYDRYGAHLLAVADRMLGSRGEAEDLVHDVFVEVWQAAGQYDPARGTVRTWLSLRTRSRALDRIRSPARRRSVDWEAVTASRLEAKDVDAGTALDAARVHPILAELPETQRQVLMLGYFEGLTCSEMAEELQIPIGTVKSRVAAALRKMREKLAPPVGAGGAS